MPDRVLTHQPAGALPSPKLGRGEGRKNAQPTWHRRGWLGGPGGRLALGSGMAINTVPPEKAAGFLREVTDGAGGGIQP
ncbi:MAG TPA: hypothetical protein VK395_28130 [Gemmataceae bacterium]|nr:hypothetical protein [Gemmataceae bacterium]